jgi:Ser/Thr protein kinase RdoA (MazF antagonist)
MEEINMMKLRNLIANTDGVAKECISKWGFDVNNVSFWRGSANYVYVINNTDKAYYLRFALNEERTLSEIEAEFEFLTHLKTNNFPAAYPVKSKDGKYIETIHHPQGTYYATVFEGAKGCNLEIEEMKTEDFHNWGISLAKLHNLSSEFTPQKNKRKDYKDILDGMKCILTDLPDEAEAISELSKASDWLSSLSLTEDNFGLIHYDYELDNIFWDKDLRIFTAIDFDDSMYFYYAMDIAYALRDLNELSEEKAYLGLEAFLQGYKTIRDISDTEVKNFSKFRRFADLLTYVRLKYTMKDSNFDNEPEWLTNLRPRLVNKCQILKNNFNLEWV